MIAPDFSTLPPYDLGLTEDEQAIPYLVRFLYCGDSSERLLAASAIATLASRHPQAGRFAAIALLDSLDDPAPQTRHAILQALQLFQLPSDAHDFLQHVMDTDAEPLNRDLAGRLLAKHSFLSAPPPIAAVPVRPSGIVRPEPIDIGGRATLEALNRFLEAVYGESCRVSDLLTRRGLKDQELETLRREHLDAFIRQLQRSIREWISTLTTARTTDVCIRRFALDGHPAQTLAELGDEYGVSRERIRQIETKMLRRLRHQRAALERLIVATACAWLGIPPPERPSDRAAVQTPRNQKPYEPPVSSSEPLARVGDSSRVTLSRFEAGLSPESIAAERGLAVSTIYGHLAKSINAGLLDVARVVSAEEIALVRTIMERDTPPQTYSELLNLLPETFTSGIVRCITAAYPELAPIPSPEANE